MRHTDGLGRVIENNLARRGDHKRDLILRIGKRNTEIAVVMHAPEADAIVPPVNPADNDVRRQRRGVGISVAEESGEQRAEVIGTEIVGAQDDLLAEWG